MSHLKDLFHFYLNGSGCKAAVWAFGEGFESLHYSELPKLWNAKHAELFEINEDQCEQTDIRRICEAWKNAEIDA